MDYKNAESLKQQPECSNSNPNFMTKPSDVDTSTLMNKSILLSQLNKTFNNLSKRKFSQINLVPDADLVAKISLNKNADIASENEDYSENSFQLADQSYNVDQKRMKLFKAVALINAHVLLYTLSNSMFKFIKQTEGVTPADFMIFRYGAMFMMTTSALKKAKINPFTDVPQADHQRVWVLMRCVIGLAGFTCFTLGVCMIPLSILMVIVMTNPFWTMVLAYFISGIKLKLFEVLAMMSCFVGVCVIVLSKPQETASDTQMSSTKTLGYVVAGLTALLFSGQYAISSKIQNIKPQIIIFYVALFGFIGGFIWQSCNIAFSGGPLSITSFSAGTYCFLLVNCIVDYGQMACAVRAFQLGDAGFISVFGTLGVAYAFLIDVLFFNENISVLQIGGAFVIVLTTIVMAIIKFYLEKKASEKAETFKNQEFTEDSEYQMV